MELLPVEDQIVLRKCRGGVFKFYGLRERTRFVSSPKSIWIGCHPRHLGTEAEAAGSSAAVAVTFAQMPTGAGKKRRECRRRRLDFETIRREPVVSRAGAV
jgi:hypothetical protein